jgi:hypothetical protein
VTACSCHAFFVSPVEHRVHQAQFAKLQYLLVVSELPTFERNQIRRRFAAVRNVTTLVFLSLLFLSSAEAQSTTIAPPAEQTIQPSQSVASNSIPQSTRGMAITIPAGTPIEVEVAYTVNSLDMKPGERISFRVLVPIVIDGVALIEKDALVTARITQVKRGGHWGKAGKLTWSMEDVVATDNSRVSLAPESASRNEALWSLENTNPKGNEPAKGLGTVKGTSHGGEVATRAILSGILFPPLGLLHGFKRGENAVLREGRRFVVIVGRDTTVKTATAVVAR